ncbi:hypothetical protein [Methanopyrus kandleri]
MRRTLPSTIVPIALLVLPLPVHGDAWVPPEALLDVGVQSHLVIEGVHEKEVTTEHGGTVKVLDYVDATYVAVIKAKEPGKPVTVHVLLPQDTEMLEARFYPKVSDRSPSEVLSDPSRFESVKVEPKGQTEVTWEFLDETWKWTQLDFEVTPEHDPGKPFSYSLLVLKLRIPAVHRMPDLRMYYPKHYDDALRSEYSYGVIEWPIPAQPGYDNSFYVRSGSETLDVGVELFAWPEGVVTKSSAAPGWDTCQARLTDHLMLVFPEARVAVLADVSPAEDYEKWKHQREEVIEKEWPQVTQRFGFPYVPVVAVIGVERVEVSFDLLVPERVDAGSTVTVFVRPYPEPWSYAPEEGVLRFELRDEHGSVMELGEVKLPEGSGFEGWVEFRFRAPEKPGYYTLFVEYEGPYGNGKTSATFRVEGRGRRCKLPIPVVPVIPPRRRARA